MAKRAKKATNGAKRVVKRWTQSEDALLCKQVKAFPQNMKRCFMIVSEMTGRTPAACASRWYKISLDPNMAPLYGFVTETSFSKNRKGGKGMPHNPSIFKRILKLLGFN